MKKNIILSTFAVLALGAVVVTTAFAFQGDSSKKGPNHTEAMETAMTKAITSGDYEAWKNLMTPGCKAVTVVTKEKFPQFAKMWELERAGNNIEASKIRTELGLGIGMGSHAGSKDGQGRGMGMHQTI